MRTATRSALVGVIAGMRSSSAPALVGQIRAHENRNGSKAKNVMGALFVGELIADLLPFMPARTKPFSLLARMLSGASSAARLDSDRSEKLTRGAARRGWSSRSELSSFINYGKNWADVTRYRITCWRWARMRS